MARITGLGRVFPQVDADARARIDWYHEVLGVPVGRCGVSQPPTNVDNLITFDGHPDRAALNPIVDVVCGAAEREGTTNMDMQDIQDGPDV